MSIGVLAGAGAVLSGCTTPGLPPTPAAATSASSGFDWYQAAPAPEGWKTLQLPDGTATLSYPPAAAPLPSDPGTVSAAITSASGDILLYLNATPQQGDESLTNWPAFRLNHLTGEHATMAAQISTGTGMAFTGGTGACLTDSYVTRIGSHRYREIACFVSGANASSVLVAATPEDVWDQYLPQLQQALEAYRVT